MYQVRNNSNEYVVNIKRESEHKFTVMLMTAIYDIWLMAYGLWLMLST